jgi:hypothetical protein
LILLRYFSDSYLQTLASKEFQRIKTTCFI